MKIVEMNKRINELGYNLEINRIDSDAYEDYNRVLIFSDNEPFSIATIFKEDGKEPKINSTDQKLIDLIHEFAATPYDQRGFDDIQTLIEVPIRR